MKVARLGGIADFIRGITFKPDDVVPLDTPGSVACLRTKNVQSELDLSDVWAVSSTFVKRNDRYAQEGDLVMSTANSWNLVGKVSWVPILPRKTTVGGFVSLVRPKREVVDPRYFYRWISWDKTQALLRSCARQTTNISNLSISQAEALEIPLPRLDEQKRIAAILDQADALRRLRTRALDHLNALGQAIFHQMFGDVDANANNWPTALLETLVHSDDRINYGVVQPGDHDPNGVPIIRAGDLTSLMVDLGRVKRISRDIDQEYSRSRLKGGEILIGCVGSIGTTLIAPKEYQGANIARAVARVPVDPSLCNPVYLNTFLRTAAVRNYFLKEVRLVAQPTLNIKQIKETAILLAPRELQDSFAERIGAVESAQAVVKLTASASDALFTSLQHRAFRGEL